MFFSVCSPTSPRSLGRSSPNLVGRLRAAPDISSMGSFFLRSRSSRSKVKFLYLGSPWSDLHEIGECILYRLIPDSDLWVQLGQRSSRSKVKFMCFFFCWSCFCFICLHRRNHLTATSRRVKFASSIKCLLTVEIKLYWHHFLYANNSIFFSFSAVKTKLSIKTKIFLLKTLIVGTR